MVFVGGSGGERETDRVCSTGSVFAGQHTFLNNPIFYVIYYRLNSGDFVSDHREKCPRPRHPGQTCVLFKCRQVDDLFHTLNPVKGMVHIVPPRTPRNSGYGVLYTCGLFFMLFLLYVRTRGQRANWWGS
jgi:hypothetical protein